MQLQQSERNFKMDRIKTFSKYDRASWKDIEELTAFLKPLISTDEENFFVAFMHHTVSIGKFNGDFQTYPGREISLKHLLDIRVFNKDEEVYIRRRGGKGFNWRYRRDEEGSDCDVVDIHQVLWGTDVEELQNGWNRVFEARGTELIVPFKNKDLKIDDKQNRIKILTRHYIDYKNHQAGYADARMVKFTLPDG